MLSILSTCCYDSLLTERLLQTTVDKVSSGVKQVILSIEVFEQLNLHPYQCFY